MYDNGVENCNLHNSAIEVLTYFQKKGVRQFVLSAMEQGMLKRTLKHNSVFDFFESIYGLNNHYAVSKTERGKQLISEFNIEKENTWIIGDTIHDYEVAEKLDIKTILITNGHQSEARLRNTGSIVISKLKELENVQLLKGSEISSE